MAGLATLCPARLEPVFSPRPWGSLSLAPFFPEMSNLAEPLGEAWMTASESRFVDGPFAGKKLGEAWPKMTPEWTGSLVHSGPIFPLLVKFLFTEEKLSVQVHPPDDYAALHEQETGGRGKTEMWYVVRARPRAEVMAGIKSGVTREAFRGAIANGTAEDCLQHIALRAGDVVFVPAGTAHTMGPGLVICEIQQHSDITYRVYDYDRRDAQGQPRQLHIEKALEVIQFGAQHAGKIEPVRKDRAGRTETHFVACRYFATERWEFTETIDSATSPEHFDLLIFLEGNGSIRWRNQDEQAEYGPAQVWMLPAALGDYQLAPGAPTALLRTHVPCDLAEFSSRLAQSGVSDAERSRLIHR